MPVRNPAQAAFERAASAFDLALENKRLPRLPILLEYEESRVREQLNQKAKTAKIASYVIPFDVDDRVLIVPKADYRRVKQNAEMILDFVERRIRPIPKDADKLKAWNDEVLLRLAKFYRKEEWRVFMLVWAFRAKPAEAFFPGENLATNFFRFAMQVEGTANVRTPARDLRAKCEPQDSTARLIRVAFELQMERDTDALIRDYGPRVVLLAASLFPTGSLPIVIGAAVTAITGFLEFMQTLKDAEADGDVTEEEVKQAEWAMLGILPFRFAQIALTVVSVGQIGIAFLRALRDGLAQFPEWLSRFEQARDAGWNSYAEFPKTEAILLPKYLVRR